MSLFAQDFLRRSVKHQASLIYFLIRVNVFGFRSKIAAHHCMYAMRRHRISAALAALSMAPSVLASSTWFQALNGSCTVSGRCFQSTNYSSELVYPEGDECTLEALMDGTLDVVFFWTQVDIDYLHVDQKKYSGKRGPQDVVVQPGTKIKFDADSSAAWINSRVVQFGFEICYESTPAPTASPKPTLSLAPTLSPSLSSDRYFAVSSGSCGVEGLCLTTPEYPGSYPASEGCNVTALQGGELRVDLFATEYAYDILFVDGVAFSGVGSGPSGVSLATGSSLLWSPDAQTQEAGFKICYVGAPSPAPTASCSAGTFFSLEFGSCIGCPIGTYSTSVGTAPFPTECSPCPAGKYNSETSGASIQSCRECASGMYAEASSSKCLFCGEGYTSSEGAGSCVLADSGFFLDPTTAEALPCPANAVCNGGTMAPVPRAGYWVDRSSRRHVGTVYECDHFEACTGGGGGDQACWDEGAMGDDVDAATAAVCDADALLCKKGSRAIMCGACANGYTYSSTKGHCVECSEGGASSLVVFSALAVLGVLALFAKARVQSLSAAALEVWPASYLKYINRGMLKTGWGTFTIIASVSWNLNVTFPQPFKSATDALNVLSFNFFTFDCFSGSPNHFRDVYFVSLVPLTLLVLLYLITGCRVLHARLAAPELEKPARAQALGVAIILGYVALPPVSLTHFQSLDCETLADGASFLRVATNVDCESTEYLQFRAVLVCLLVCYQLIPLAFLAFLVSERFTINPQITPGVRNSHLELEKVLKLREHFRCDCQCKFLWEDYKPEVTRTCLSYARPHFGRGRWCLPPRSRQAMPV